ncbi:CPBP family intramembrane glutamic endopeptidase [Pediococcus argentinicus]|uniref:Metal-dependent membrane protease n=1 Tax=Pediococcus argentinicus TaxID=480391 RepID=A0A0R2NMZ5_9LACO|nr:type II CAAX endopeptidase family protein [Pediococcus argentinicus]KRO25760.1 metal-dependent membrane protease [Pediococcus argentinicus]NKZ21926.1 CPBP family intramembrane metalloprotease [Pediococcus argentinicus]GEP19095.1 CAAX amino protease [Pediococcus argentinicus]
MKLAKSSIAILFSYLVIFLLPSLLNSIFNIKNIIISVQTWDYLIGAIVLATLLYFTKEKNSIDSNKNGIDNVVIWGFIGLFLALLIQFAISFILILTKQNPASENTAQLLTLTKASPFFILTIVIGAPIMEEIVFRKVIFGNLNKLMGWDKSSVGITMSAIISSLAFALMHQDGHIFMYATLGLLFCWIYRKTGRIQTTMISHILMNTFVALPVLFK